MAVKKGRGVKMAGSEVRIIIRTVLDNHDCYYSHPMLMTDNHSPN